jgi:hypothetical protein
MRTVRAAGPPHGAGLVLTAGDLDEVVGVGVAVAPPALPELAVDVRGHRQVRLAGVLALGVADHGGLVAMHRLDAVVGLDHLLVLVGSWLGGLGCGAFIGLHDQGAADDQEHGKRGPAERGRRRTAVPPPGDVAGAEVGEVVQDDDRPGQRAHLPAPPSPKSVNRTMRETGLRFPGRRNLVSSGRRRCACVSASSVASEA